jgi:hypothetical protein
MYDILYVQTMCTKELFVFDPLSITYTVGHVNGL